MNSRQNLYLSVVLYVFVIYTQYGLCVMSSGWHSVCSEGTVRRLSLFYIRPEEGSWISPQNYVGFKIRTCTNYVGFKIRTCTNYVGFKIRTCTNYVGFKIRTCTNYVGFKIRTCTSYVGFKIRTCTNYEINITNMTIYCCQNPLILNQSINQSSAVCRYAVWSVDDKLYQQAVIHQMSL